jgi:4-hydroxybenzoate polyprenyltransferase
MLSGLQFLTGYFTFDPAPFMHWIFPFLFVFCISCYGEMFNEMRDLDGDLKAGLKHTAAVLGPRVTARLMGAVMVLAVISGIITAFVIRLVGLLGLMACSCPFADLYPPCGHANSSEQEWNRPTGVLSKAT